MVYIMSAPPPMNMAARTIRYAGRDVGKDPVVPIYPPRHPRPSIRPMPKCLCGVRPFETGSRTKSARTTNESANDRVLSMYALPMNITANAAAISRMLGLEILRLSIYAFFLLLTSNFLPTYLFIMSAAGLAERNASVMKKNLYRVMPGASSIPIYTMDISDIVCSKASSS